MYFVFCGLYDYDVRNSHCVGSNKWMAVSNDLRHVEGRDCDVSVGIVPSPSFEASAALLIRSVFFWDITRRRMVIVFWPLKMGPIRCPEMSVNNYDTMPRNIPEERGDYPCTCAEGLRKTTKTLGEVSRWPGRDESRRPLEYQSGALPLQPSCWVRMLGVVPPVLTYAIMVWCLILKRCPDRPSFLYNGYLTYPGGKAAGECC
jgi:hypothetical protein